jgi:membrane protease YdiL (CAAX protease family)
MKHSRKVVIGVPWLFVGLTYGISWVLWILVILSGQDAKGSWLFVPYVLGGFSPSIVGVFLLYRTRKAGDRPLFWKSLVGFGRISWRWYLFIFLVIPAIFALSVLLESLLAGHVADLSILRLIRDNPVQIVQILVIALFFGSLSEELGWRGFALGRLQSKWNAFVSSIILGPIWFFWHLPLFFVNGTTQKLWGFGSIGFFGFFLFLMASTLIITWVYNRNGNSLLSAVLIHCVSNLVLNLVPLSGEGFFIQGAIVAIVAVLFVLLSGTKGPGARQAA